MEGAEAKRAKHDHDAHAAATATTTTTTTATTAVAAAAAAARMALYVKRLSEAATLPVRASAGAAGYDLFWYGESGRFSSHCAGRRTHDRGEWWARATYITASGQLEGDRDSRQGEGDRADGH